MVSAVIGLGSNLGSREALIRTAVSLLAGREEIDVVSVSPLYETEPVGPPQGMFLNAAARIMTTDSPERLLQTLLRTERRLGRRRDAEARWGPRAIDLDLLWVDGVRMKTDVLTLPHARLTERSFALKPLLDVVPSLEQEYGDALIALGPTPVPWGRSARVLEETATSVTVEADSIVDALCVAILGSGVSRDRATVHRLTTPSPNAWVIAVNEIVGAGFSPSSVTVSHCSESQWRLSIHGMPRQARCRRPFLLEVGVAAERNHRVTLSHDS